MHPRLAAALLTLLLAVPLAAPALAAPAGRPNLAVVKQPEYTPGDFWGYRTTFLDAGGNVTRVENQTLQVLELDQWNGTPTYRVLGTGNITTPPQPGDRLQTTVTDITNRTLWWSRQGLKTLHLDVINDRNTESTLFKQLARRHLNTTFHEPEDRYQFPILGGGATGEGDAWLVVTNVTVLTNSSFITTIQGNTTTSYASENTSHVSDTSRAQWLRQDRIETFAGPLDVVVIQVLSGNTTVFEFWAPAIGNFARQEIIAPDGHLVQTIVLTKYAFAKAPDLEPTSRAPQPLEPLLLLAVVAVVAAVAGAAYWRKRQRGAPPASPPPSP